MTNPRGALLLGALMFTFYVAVCVARPSAIESDRGMIYAAVLAGLMFALLFFIAIGGPER